MADQIKPTRGRLIVLSAPSGAGKTTLVRRSLERDPNLRFSISYTTRPARPTERDGRDYHFVTAAEFEAMVGRGEFLEHAQVFGNRYGTSRSCVDKLLAAGHNVLLEIDWQGARQIRRNAAACSTVFVLPPSVPELEHRLRSRASDSNDVIERRLAQAVDDMSHWSEFDYVVINEQLDAAIAALTAIVAGQGEAHRADQPAIRDRVRRLLGQ